jgi:hypothetical protein
MFPRISGSKVWLPYTVETEDGARGCGTYELGGLNRHAEDGRTLSIVLSLPKLAHLREGWLFGQAPLRRLYNPRRLQLAQHF